MDNTLVPRIEKVYMEYSSLAGFPSGKCKDVTDELKTLGLTQVGGWFQVDMPIPYIGIRPKHNWSELDGIIIDLTAAQFNTWLNEPVQPGVLIISPQDSLYRRYLRVKDMMFC